MHPLYLLNSLLGRMAKGERIAFLAGGGITVIGLSPAATADPLNMPRGVTDISAAVYDLHMLIFWICVVIGAGVYAVIAWSMIRHRRDTGREPAPFHENAKLEVLWTIVPALILVGMAWPATRTLIAMYDTGGEDMTVEVRAYQWRWQYTYLDDDLNGRFGFFSNLATPRHEIENRSIKGENYLLEVDNPLRIPVNQKVRFLLTSEDVIHAFWVPDFGIKRDAIPGMLNELWTIVNEPGVYRGQCAELCGRDHGFMPIVVQVMSEKEYQTWYASQMEKEEQRLTAQSSVFSADQLMSKGEQVYKTFCASCHQVNGKGIPPVFPGLAGSPIATGPIDQHIDIVLNGVPGTAMQAFGKQLDAADIAAVTYYERNGSAPFFL